MDVTPCIQPFLDFLWSGPGRVFSYINAPFLDFLWSGPGRVFSYINGPLYSALKNLHQFQHYNMMPRSFILDYNLCSKLHSSDLAEDSPIVEDVLKLSSHQYIDDPLYSALKNLHQFQHYNTMSRGC